jgi:hypothetical protein
MRVGRGCEGRWCRLCVRGGGVRVEVTREGEVVCEGEGVCEDRWCVRVGGV